MKKFHIFEILFFLASCFSLYWTWTRGFHVTDTQIPSIINGLVSSISMIVGFTGAMIIFALSKQWDKLRLGMRRPSIYLLLVAVPLALLWSMYSYYLQGNLELALKMSMADLLIASVVLIDFLAYHIREIKLEMKEKYTKMEGLKEHN